MKTGVCFVSLDRTLWDCITSARPLTVDTDGQSKATDNEEVYSIAVHKKNILKLKQPLYFLLCSCWTAALLMFADLRIIFV